jgi:hypothetical protein
MRTIIENPAPLNANGNFPFKVTPFPADWLLKFTSLGKIKDSATPRSSQADKPSINKLTSLESWT